MGFYGNITNTNKTQFTFDKSYPNRKTMEARLASDGVYLGRYVLIEYDLSNNNTLDTFLKCYVRKNASGQEEFFTSPNFEDTTRVLWSEPKNETDIYWEPSQPGTVTTNQFIYVEKDLTPGNKDNVLSTVFYQCTNVKQTSVNGSIATFRLIAASETPYTSNYNIDTAAYGAGRGYDSTVWQKVYHQGTERYVMIAELNSVVPTFDLAVDAPTMTPITPHFDEYSTNVYYKLHWQPQWGLRIAEETDMNKNSDGNARWVSTSYDPATDIIHTTTRDDVRAAINFNGPAFDPQVNKQDTINKHDDGENYFTILPTGKSGQLYNTHNGTGEFEQKPDIQEIRINLPAIGNMMSDAWDIIHGPNRNDARTDENGSLKGRLDSFKAMYANQIPVKNVNGVLVGSKINGANPYDAEQTWTGSDKPADILYDNTNPTFERDDAWIQVDINTTNLKTGDKGTGSSQASNSGISIHHTYHSTDNTTSKLDKNTKTYTDLVDSSNANVDDDKKEKVNALINKNNTNGDNIQLYTPYVDAKGHVVGHNIETVTLPYSYRTYKTNGLSNEEIDLHTTITVDNNGAHTDATATVSETLSTANNTQDILYINTKNKWIQTKFEDDKLTIAHEIHAIPTNSNGTSNANADDNAADENNLNIPDWSYDAAGHITGKHDHYYTLPFGYKTITTNGRGNGTAVNATTDPVTVNVVADTTQDSLAINSGNQWIRIDTDADNDSLTISHDIHNIETTAATDTDLNDGTNTITIQDITLDDAGHVTKNKAHTYTLPYGYKNITPGASSSAVAEITSNTTSIVADSTQDTLTVAPGNKWVRVAGNNTNDTLTIAHEVHTIDEAAVENATNLDSGTGTIMIPDLDFDEAGHVTENKAHTYNLPYAIRNIKIGNNSSVSAGTTPAKKEDQTDDEFTASLRVDATIYNDTLNLNAQNRWITLDRNKDSKIITIGHAAAGNEKNTAGETADIATLQFGSSFTVPYVKYDEMGHISASGTRSITLQKPSMEDVDATEARVLTGIAMTDETGAITTTYSNVGALELTDYTAKNDADSTYVTSTDSINAAFRKIDDRLDAEIAAARAAEGKVLDDAKAYTDAAKKAILTGDATGPVAQAYDTLFKIANWINGDGVNATELTTAIANEADDRSKADANLQDQIDALGISDGKVSKAATADVANSLSNSAKTEVKAVKVDEADNASKLNGVEASSYLLKNDAAGYNDILTKAEAANLYATKAQGALAESALQLNTPWVYKEKEEDEGISYTIESLLQEIINLKKQVEELTIKVNTAHPDETETPPPSGDGNEEPETPPDEGGDDQTPDGE